MNQIIIEWYGNSALLSEETDSDFYDYLKPIFPIQNKSKEEVDKLIYESISNMANNHYGKFEEHTNINHRILL